MPLYLCRHGQTDWNLEKRFQSRTDIPLNATGIAQAEALRDELRRRAVVFSAARSSPMGRAIATARIVLEGSSVELVIEPLFSELDFGGFEARLESELREEFGAAYDAWRDGQYTQSGPAGGENIISGAERVRGALEALKLLARKGELLIVAHQAVNMAMKVALSGRSDIESAASFRQNNDEVDVWDMDRGVLLERFTISTG